MDDRLVPYLQKAQTNLLNKGRSMKASNVRVKLFSLDTTSEMEARINNWLRDNPDNEIHTTQLVIQKAVHVMVVYEPPGSVNEPDFYGTKEWQDELEAYNTKCRERGKT